MYHKELAGGRWQKMSFIDQMANIGSEVIRAIRWRNKDRKNSQLAFERSLELMNLTIDDKKNKSRLRELTRLYEIWVDYFVGDNQYGYNDKVLNNYFLAFNYAARINK